MYKTLLLFCLGLYTTTLAAQINPEFETHNNGLIYSEATMKTLQHLVDSLNLKFKKCELNKVFYAKKQTLGHAIQLDKGNIQQAKIDLENQMPLNEFILKYPFAKVEKNVLLIKYNYTDYKNKEKIVFHKVGLNKKNSLEIVCNKDQKPYEQACKNTWVWQYDEKTEYSKEEIIGFYFPEEFESKPLPSKYALQIAYADCLIDTTATKFKSELTEGWIDLPENWQALSKDNQLKLLNEMRATRVVGRCSMDSSPRTHALNIALLSAETTQWEIFLKAHLDIMNDRFLRVSDGSYAFEGRKTYIKELENLNINVPDLILGTALQVENPAANHYFATVNRMGRALAEAKDKEQFKTLLLSMMGDPELDNFNRVQAYFMLLNAIPHIEDKQEQKTYEVALTQAVNTLPVVLKEKISLIKK